MKKFIYSIFCFLILFVFAVFIIYLDKPSLTLYYSDSVPTLTLSIDQIKITIHSWYDNQNDIYYFFLPSGTNSNKIVFNQDNINEITINNIHTSSTFFEYEDNTVYDFNVITTNIPLSHSVCFITSQNIPSLFINTSSETMDFIHATKSHSETGSLMFLNSSGSIEHSQSLKSISGRGNSTWYLAKKPYSFRLEKASPLCGLDIASKWCLLPNWRDSTKMQNQLVFQLANRLNMEYTPKEHG